MFLLKFLNIFYTNCIREDRLTTPRLKAECSTTELRYIYMLLTELTVVFGVKSQRPSH